MIIAFTGPQSSGKTTLIEAIKKREINIKYKFIYKPSATRTLKLQGFTINNIGENFDSTQREVILSHINNILDYCEYYDKSRNVIFDRCLLDGVVYTKYFYERGKVSDEIMKYADNVINTYYNEYDLVFYLNPIDVPLINDDERSTDIIFRKDIIQIFEQYIEKYPVIRVAGTIEQRINIIERYL